ncbi:MAG: hypothetical protein Q7T35_10250 [Nitrosomonas sp.]|nr:hypothetical protein [Nitrosomonas sp.]
MTFTNENAPNAGRHEANFETTNDSNTIQDQVTSQADSMPLFCSGFGQFHTNEPGKKTRKPYTQINLEEIRNLVDEPQQIDKSEAQWLIPSTFLSRTFKEQEVKGEFHLLWADIDENPNGIHAIAKIIEDMIPGYNFEIYTSKSATEANQKCRILIPSKPLIGSDWVLVQEMLNDKLEAYGIQPDRTSEGAAQLCYLSNRGEFYKTKSKRDGLSFDPMREWADLFQIKCEKETARIAGLERRKSEAKSQREAFNSYSGTDDFPSLIDAFNAAYTVQDILLQAGYDQKGDSFRHPNSESGSFSASVKNDRVHSLSSNDPLYTGGSGGGAHDAFSAFIVLFHDGDRDAALKDAGDNWVMIGSDYWNKVKQHEYVQQREETQHEDIWNQGAHPEYASSYDEQPAKEEEGDSTESRFDNDEDEEKELFSLKRFDITGNVDAMRQKTLDDVFVLDGIALLGQITVLYASPNTGKTLLTIKMLIDSVKEGRINGESVFYINADDTHNGMITKADIIKSYGIKMLVPDHNGFKAKDFVKHLNQLIKDGTSRGVIVVLDTLKKFSDLMDKRVISQFMTVARSFISHGGTLIMLAHTNKRRDAENKPIAGGTSDVIDDADCAYIIDAKPAALGDTRKTVIFENTKNRGNVERELCFSYSIQPNQIYSSLLISVEKHTQADIQGAKKEVEAAKAFEKDLPIIEIIQEAINSGTTKKTELVREVNNNGGGSHQKIRSILDRYTSKEWGFITDAHNTKIYHLIGKTATAEEYINATEGY